MVPPFIARAIPSLIVATAAASIAKDAGLADTTTIVIAAVVGLAISLLTYRLAR
jgi:hypothetical protein